MGEPGNTYADVLPAPDPEALALLNQVLHGDKQSSPGLGESDTASFSPEETTPSSSNDTGTKRKNDTQAERTPIKMSYTDGTDQEDAKNDNKFNSQKKPGRKPIDGDLPAGASNSEKRRAQNRAAQRAFRERKERHVRELEERIQALEDRSKPKDDKEGGVESNTNLHEENEKLRAMVERLSEENRTLKEAKFTFEMPLLSTVTDTSTITAENQRHNLSLHDAHLHTPPESSLDRCPGADSDDYAAVAATAAAVAGAHPSLFGSSVTTSGSNENSLTFADAAALSLASTATSTTTTNTAAADPANLASWLFPQMDNPQLSSPIAQASTYASPQSVSSADLTSLTSTTAVMTTPSPISVSELLSDPTLFPPLGLVTPNSANLPAVDNPAVLTTLTDASSASLGVSNLASDTSTFSQYRDTDELTALFGNTSGLTLPPELAINDDASQVNIQGGLPSASILPLEGLPGFDATDIETEPCKKEKELLLAKQILEANNGGKLDDAELDLLCQEMKSKCQASKKAAEAKLHAIQKAQQEQQERVTKSAAYSAQLELIAKLLKQ